MQDQWHYTDVKSGTRVGPVGRDDIAGLIAEEKLHRATLVWNPSMSDWAGASSTELVFSVRQLAPTDTGERS